jgi:hypothetical protein
MAHDLSLGYTSNGPPAHRFRAHPFFGSGLIRYHFALLSTFNFESHPGGKIATFGRYR